MKLFLKTPRWLLISEAVLVLCAILVVAYKALMWISPLPVDQTPIWKRKSPEAQVRDYYHQYPEGYIRISNETWQLDPLSGTAFHSFTLKNNARVPYSEIEIRFSYESSSGKTLQSQVVKIPGRLAPLGTLEAKRVPVKDVPAGTARALMSVAKATVDK
jgi:hypothetical protein